MCQFGNESVSEGGRLAPDGRPAVPGISRNRSIGSGGQFGRTAAIILTAAAVVRLGLMPDTAQAQAVTYSCNAPGFGVVPPGAVFPGLLAPVPPILLASLKTVPNPVLPNGPNGAPRADLLDFIANQAAAIQLGKALFWDIQAGSDGKTACATCHFQAGADVRTRNQLNPGANRAWNLAQPNSQFTPAQFPISPIYDDVAGSQGVRASTFLGITKSGAESTTTPTGFRQVTGKNTPSMINAVFNHRQFWNGRAQPDFNGVNPFGSRDTSARVWEVSYTGFPTPALINIQTASLASQAVGPPLSSVEMSAAGRTFADIGQKMLAVKPLGLQKVDPTDSVLGSFADTTAGLKTTYTAMIQKAFQPKWWNTNKKVSVNGASHSVMEANFSLFWGLAVMVYEATLVSDQTPMDQYLATRVYDFFTGGLLSHNPALLQPVVNRLAAEGASITVNDILTGLTLFEFPLPIPPIPNPFPAPTLPPNLFTTFGAGCSGCHFPGELTSASVRNLTMGVEPAGAALRAAGFDLRMERMFMNLPAVPTGTDTITYDPSTFHVNVIDMIVNGLPTAVSPPLPARVATYDSGWYNLGVRPSADDPGLNGTDPFGNSLSWTRLFEALTDPSFIKVPGAGLPCTAFGSLTFPFTPLTPAGFPLLSGSLLKNEPTDVDGGFKTPGLRNVEFNGPYFHNGGKATLTQAVEFYDNGGDFANPTKTPAMVPLNLTPAEMRTIVAFLVSLTDERVRWQKAPFDHPQLLVPNGENPPGVDDMITIPAVGAGGSLTPLQRFLNLSPFLP